MLVDGLWTGAILDQHLHLDRSNKFLDAISEFTRSGGTGIMLVHKPGSPLLCPQTSTATELPTRTR